MRAEAAGIRRNDKMCDVSSIQEDVRRLTTNPRSNKYT